MLTLANYRVLLWLNNLIDPATHATRYKIALLATDKGADVAVLLTMLWLWFWPDQKSAQSMFSKYQGGPPTIWHRLSSLPLWKRSGSRLQVATRLESRAQLLLFGGAAMSAYVAARLLAIVINVDRPFESFLALKGLEGVFEGLRGYGSFPSDHAVLLAAFPLALFYWDSMVAWCWTGLAVFLCLVRVALGFHYPSDMVAGALIGVAFSGCALLGYHKSATVRNGAISAARTFELSNAPYCFLCYVLLLAVGYEFARHFQHVLDSLYSTIGELRARFHR